jgi:hypothetical protein
MVDETFVAREVFDGTKLILMQGDVLWCFNDLDVVRWGSVGIYVRQLEDVAKF